MLQKILILGSGVIGGNVLDLLSRMDLELEITVAARDQQRLLERVNLAAAVAMNLGVQPRLSFETVDVFQHDALASLLDRRRPDIVINATSLQTFWRISLLPRTTYQRLLAAEVGPWLPNHLAPARRIMLAVREAVPSARVVNASFPDAVNPVLAQAGLAPFIGAGNVANTIPTLRRAAAMQLGCGVQRIGVRFVAHHVVGNSIATHGSARGAPFHLTITRDDVDVTEQVSQEELFASFGGALKRQRGIPGQVMASSSVVAITRAIATDAGEEMHAPGPLGMIGGYPVRVGADAIALRLPHGLSAADAEAINAAAQRHEGIERIDSDGTVTFVEENMEVLTTLLGYHCAEMRLAEVDSWASELQERYRRFEQSGTSAAQMAAAR